MCCCMSSKPAKSVCPNELERCAQMLSLFGISEAEFEYHLKREFNDEKFVLNDFQLLHSMFAHLYDIKSYFNILHPGEDNFNYTG